MAMRNAKNVKSLALLDSTSKLRTAWAPNRSITVGSTLQKASWKRSDKPYHTSNISKSWSASCIKANKSRKDGLKPDRRQTEPDRAAEKLRESNQLLQAYYIKRQEYQNQLEKAMTGKLTVLTRKLKDMMEQKPDPTGQGSTTRLHNLNYPQLIDDSKSQDSHRPSKCGRNLNDQELRKGPTTEPCTIGKAGGRRVWLLGSRVIPCLDL